MLMVIAGNYNEFKQFCNENDFDFRDYENVRFIYDEKLLFGRLDYDVTYYGSFMKRNDIDTIMLRVSYVREYQNTRDLRHHIRAALETVT